jgi:hypothetical protein
MHHLPTCYLLYGKYSKAYSAQILDVYHLHDTVLDCNYKKLPHPFMHNL